jgi:hypothetical protein
MTDPLKNNFINTYLAQQVNLTMNDTTMQKVETPTDVELEEFKNYVKAFIEIDNDVRKLKVAIKERSMVKNTLSKNIVAFMGKFSIEDLNTKHGKIRYQVTRSRKPLSKTDIKTRLLEVWDPSLTAVEISSKVFDNEGADMTEKHSLKRILST